MWFIWIITDPNSNGDTIPRDYYGFLLCSTHMCRCVCLYVSMQSTWRRRRRRKVLCLFRLLLATIIMAWHFTKCDFTVEQLDNIKLDVLDNNLWHMNIIRQMRTNIKNLINSFFSLSSSCCWCFCSIHQWKAV